MKAQPRKIIRYAIVHYQKKLLNPIKRNSVIIIEQPFNTKNSTDLETINL